MRAFSTLEILIALALAATSIVACALIVFGTPFVLENARLERRAYGLAGAILTEAELGARKNFDSVAAVATTTDGTYERSLAVEYLQESLAARLTARVRWTDTYGRLKEVALDSLIADPEAARDESCSPVVSGNWREPRILATYRLPGDLVPGMTGRYPISDIGTTGNHLLLAVASTTLSIDPALFLFSLGSAGDRPEFMGSFDNASTSRVGFTAVATGGGYVYAANNFGSASQATCSTGACAQILVFDPKETLEPVGKLTLSTTAPPHAVSAGNITTPAKSIAYRKEFVYLGLEKTVSGYEFNIIDVHDPGAPTWQGGVAIGRSVNDIGVQGGYAYLATSDPARELVVVDVHDPTSPHIAGYWNAPGATNFGLGSVIVARLPRLYFGRTYVGNSPEFLLLDADNPATPVPIHENDPGTLLRPESVQGIVVRDFLTAVLSGKRLELWNTGGGLFETYASPVPLPGTGTSLACRGNTLYVGTIDAGGDGVLILITDS